MSSGVCVINFLSPSCYPQPSGPDLIRQQKKFISQWILYLRHLREQADGHRQREAEGNQAHEAVDGQQQSAVALQESQPTHTKSSQDRDKKANKSLCGSISHDCCESQALLFLDLAVWGFWGELFCTISGCESSNYELNESDCRYFILFHSTIEIEILFLITLGHSCIFLTKNILVSASEMQVLFHFS